MWDARDLAFQLRLPFIINFYQAAIWPRLGLDSSVGQDRCGVALEWHGNDVRWRWMAVDGSEGGTIIRDSQLPIANCLLPISNCQQPHQFWPFNLSNKFLIVLKIIAAAPKHVRPIYVSLSLFIKKKCHGLGIGESVIGDRESGIGDRGNYSPPRPANIKLSPLCHRPGRSMSMPFRVEISLRFRFGCRGELHIDGQLPPVWLFDWSAEAFNLQHYNR